MGLFTTPSLPSLASAAAAGAPGLAAAGGCAAGPGEAGAPRLLEATRGAWGVGVCRPERATRSFTPSCSSSNSVMSCSSRIRRISLISLTSKRFPPLPVALLGLRGKVVLFPPAAGLSRKRLLELALETEARHPQREAGSSRQRPRSEGGKEEVLPGDPHQDRDQPLRDHPQLPEVAEAGVGRGGHAGPQQGRVLGGHGLHVRVGADHELLDRDPVR